VNAEILNANRARADELALPMFVLSALFLVLLAALIVVWVDIPRVAELNALNHLDTTSHTTVALLDHSQLASAVQTAPLVKRTDHIGKLIQLSLLVIWPLFWLEFLSTLRRSKGASPVAHGGVIRILACLIPPLRLTAPCAARDGQIWLPALNWQTPGKQLSKKLDRAFSKPMLMIALLILPILFIEYGLHSLVEDYAWLRMLLHVSTGFIWCAFAFEFIIMVSAADKKLLYIRKHWIDLAIILLPLISFLRSVRALRLAKLARVQKLAKMGRIYRMRGLLMKAVRALMLFEVVHRLLRVTPEKRLIKLKADYEDRLEDLEDLKTEIQQLESELASDAYVNS